MFSGCCDCMCRGFIWGRRAGFSSVVGFRQCSGIFRWCDNCVPCRGSSFLERFVKWWLPNLCYRSRFYGFYCFTVLPDLHSISCICDYYTLLDYQEPNKHTLVAGMTVKILIIFDKLFHFICRKKWKQIQILCLSTAYSFLKWELC